MTYWIFHVLICVFVSYSVMHDVIYTSGRQCTRPCLKTMTINDMLQCRLCSAKINMTHYAMKYYALLHHVLISYMKQCSWWQVPLWKSYPPDQKWTDKGWHWPVEFDRHHRDFFSFYSRDPIYHLLLPIYLAYRTAQLGEQSWKEQSVYLTEKEKRKYQMRWENKIHKKIIYEQLSPCKKITKTHGGNTFSL